MPSLATTAFILASAGLSIAAPAVSRRSSGPTCSDVNLTVTITAQNHAVPQYLLDGLDSASLTPSGLESLLNGAGNELQLALVNGTWNIAGLYCEPEVQVAGRENTVQLLVHGITFDHHYWTGGVGGTDDQYSWIAHASKQGYATLAIDRLGAGASDHPDPITVVQKPTHVEIAHQVVQALRAGKFGGRQFSKVAYVGHSYGSLIGNTLAARYPADADALVLTGYTSEIKQSVAGVVITPGGAPAAIVDPARFGKLSLGYSLMTLEAGARSLFYTSDAADWDAAVVANDWKNRHTFTQGEALSTFFVNDVADDFDKPVLVLTGHEDQIFCGLALPLLGPGDCTGYGDKTARLFPSADYRFQDVANTGHAMNFHHTAGETFAAAHDFLEGAGF